MERFTFWTWDPVQRIFTDSNDFHNKETLTEIIQSIGLTSEDLENDPKEMRTKKQTTLDDDDLEKTYARSQVQYYETATYAILSKQVGRKPQSPSFNSPPLSPH